MIVKLFNSKENRYTFSCIVNYALENKVPVYVERNFIKFDVTEFRDFLSCVLKAFRWISRGICRDDGQDPTYLLSRRYFCSIVGYKDMFWFQLDWEYRGIRYGVCSGI